MVARRIDISLQDCHGLALRKAARQVGRFYDECLSPCGLRATQFALLAVLNHRDEVSVNELAALLALDRTTAGKNLLPLERSGYINVSPSPTDHRSRLARLTRAGAAALQRAYPYWQQAQAAFERDNGKRDAEQLRGALQRLRVQRASDPAKPSAAAAPLATDSAGTGAADYDGG